ncbi:MAG: polysaccharide deacetylase family protein [Crocinitomicaceae bacterium]
MTDSKVPIKIFSDIQSPRLNYVLDFIFTEKGLAFELTNDINSKHDLAYTKLKTGAKLLLLPCGMLSEAGVSKNWNIEFNSGNNIWTVNGELDDLAIIFYFLSRYEEYTDEKRDEIGRYSANQSLLYKAQQLHQPWGDILVKNIWKKLGLNTLLLEKQYKTILTYDIDIAWAYLHKPVWRTTANILKELLNPKALKERMTVLREKKNDPYDSYDRIKENAKRHETVLFFLLGDYGKLDKNHSWKNANLQSLIQSFINSAKLGIHPSFNSFLKIEKIIEETERLGSITGMETILSRQHYLRMTWPESMQILQKAGITHDYTMGYADHYGFRASTSFSFHFFDLTTNSKKPLKIVPFAFMDGTLKDYMKLNPKDAINIILDLKKTVKSVGGQFIPLWHNHSIGNQMEWRDWQIVYEACLDKNQT